MKHNIDLDHAQADTPQVAITGGGMLGLVLAYRLSQYNINITLFEASETPGGLTASWQLDGFTWDRYYHVTLLSDLKLRALLNELGLEESIDWQVTKTNFFSAKGMFPLNNAMDYLKLPVISFIDKIRLAFNIEYGSRIENGKKLEKQTAKKWLSKWSGKNTYEQIWRPLLRAKLGSNYQKASASFIWSVMRRFYAARRGGMKTEMFGYVPGGYERIIQALLSKLARPNVQIINGAKVDLIKQNGSGFSVTTQQKEYRFDKVISTFSSDIIAKVCKDLPTDEAIKHSSLTYQGIVCPSVVLSRPLGGAYLTYITDETIPFTAVIEMSSLVNRVQFNEKHLVYLPKYVASDDPIFKKSDALIQTEFLAGLRQMFPDLQEDEIEAFQVSRTRQVVALSTLNYSENLPPMVSKLEGFYAVNSAQIINAALNVNDTVLLANNSALAIAKREGWHK